MASLDGTVLALDRHGVERWAYHAPGRVFASPALVGETAIVGYDGGAYVAIGPRGVPVWTYPTTEDADAPPMVALDGTVFVASATVAALDAGGHARWTLPLAGHAFGPPALTPDGRTVVVTELPGAVDFVDAATGHTGHRVQLPAPTRGGVLVLDNGAVVVGADDGHLRCITTEGTTRWDVVVGSATAHAGIRATPALGRDGTVIVGSEDGGIHGVRATDGGTVFNVATGGPVRSSARVDGDGWIYVGSEDDNVWALHPDGTVGWTASLGNDVDGTPAIPVDGLLVVSCDDGGIYGLGEAPPRD